MAVHGRAGSPERQLKEKWSKSTAISLFDTDNASCRLLCPALSDITQNLN